MRLLKTLLLWLCIPLIALSQGRTVSGVVTDQATGAPLNGVTVTEKNTNNAVSTNEAGQFTIQVAGKGAVLQISYVGYAQQELAVGNSNSLSVALKVEERALQEVYVVAYGNQSKRTLTSAVSTVGAEQIGRQQVTTVTQALQGTAAGVLVVNNSGQPGDAPQIRIRGIASVNASAQPLIVVDGVPFDGNINMINPNDIDNFSILKDASATALYGSRAANGVVLITTKGGRKNQKPKVTLNAATGFSSRALPEYEFANLQQLMELNWEGLRNLYQDAGVANPAQQASTDLIREHLLYNPYGNPEPVGTNGQLLPGLSPKWNTDWTKELTRKQAVRQDVNLGMAGGSNNNTYYFGLGYLGQEGYL
ncbi:MAG TPA: TonB-dependent receptor plug domain-containing protein, partial [Phnomibacter sp.]|nr:TonB-dependent receptor plug domain-containing protein [Phnomibacter sp.]